MTIKPLEGKTALVTGAARNIGRAITLALAEDGANIIVNSVQDHEAAKAVAAEVEALGVGSQVSICDVTDAPAVEKMIAEAKDRFGSVDIFISNASARGMVDFLDMSHEQWRRVIDISLDGAFHCSQAILPMMIEKGWGRIVTLGGIAWHIAIPRRAHNLTAKAGLTGFTRALAAEFGAKGITANSIAPGAIDTVRPASAGALPKRDNPPVVGRTGHVDEVASTVRFLCHPQQAFINGQIVHLNGGAFMGT